MNDSPDGFVTIKPRPFDMQSITFYRTLNTKMPLRLRIAWTIARFAHWIATK